MPEFNIDVATFAERVGDPSPIANTGKFYTKDVAGVTQAFYEASDGTVVQLTGNGVVVLPEQGGDPGPVANTGKVYTKDDAGVTQLFYEASDGTVYQLTPTGGGGGGGDVVSRVTVTGPTTYAVLTTDQVIYVDTTAGAVTLTLPDPSTTNRIYEIKDITGTFGTNACTLARNNVGDTIEGLAVDYLLEAPYQIQRIASNATTAWWLH